jgi:Fur family transcriptional regulator, ferric uptake regulator
VRKRETAETKETSVAEWKERIRKAGLRSTGARVAVLRLMERATRPLTHQEVSSQLEGAGFDHATIFRNLNDLTDVGLLSRGDLGDHVWRFEFRRGGVDHKGQHPHFICTSCGEVECLPDRVVSVQPTAHTPRALKRKGVIVQIQGRCDSCERQAAAG